MRKIGKNLVRLVRLVSHEANFSSPPGCAMVFILVRESCRLEHTRMATGRKLHIHIYYEGAARLVDGCRELREQLWIAVRTQTPLSRFPPTFSSYTLNHPCTDALTIICATNGDDAAISWIIFETLLRWILMRSHRTSLGRGW